MTVIAPTNTQMRIGIFLDEKTLKKKVMSIVTDAAPVEAPKDPQKCNLYNIYKLFAPEDRLREVHALYVDGGAAYGYIKQELVGLIWDYFRAARARREELVNDPAYLKEVLARGAQQAREKAAQTLDLVRNRVGLLY